MEASDRGEETPGARSVCDRPRCGKAVGQDGDRVVLCELPAGHEVATACRVPTNDMRAINRRVIEQFRSHVEVEDFDRDGLILLSTTGARTGRLHTTPMAYYRDGDRLLVVASFLGAQEHPHWYVNLLASARVRVEISDDTYDALAVPLTAEERDTAWKRLVTTSPFLADHQASTPRIIPVVAITRMND